MFFINAFSLIKYSFIMNFKIKCINLINCVTCNSSWFNLENSFNYLFEDSFQFFSEKFKIFNLIEWFSFILNLFNSSFWFFEFNRMSIDFVFASIFMTTTDKVRKTSRIFFNATFCNFWSLFRNFFWFFHQIFEL